MSLYLRLVYEFGKIGLFSVGGGMATLPFLYELSDRSGWFSHGDIVDMIAVAEATPGAIGINMSTYAGFTTGGIAAGILATLGLALPSFIIIILVAKGLEKFKSNRYVKRLFYGLRPASVALISAAGINVAKTALLHTEFLNSSGSLLKVVSWKACLLGLVLWYLNKKTSCHPVALIALSAAFGILMQF